MIKEFIKQLLNEINKYYDCYYEEASNNATFPYLVIPTLHFIPLNAGYSAIVDIEINNNELSEIMTEEIIDNLNNILNGFNFINDKIGFHLGLSDINILKSSDQDLINRRISFEARLFKMIGGKNVSRFNSRPSK